MPPMRCIVWALAVLVHVHVQLSIAACVNNTSEPFAASAACDNAGSQGISGSQSSLLQMARQTHLTPKAPTEQTRKRTLQLAFDDVFLYDHLPKAGGSFIRAVLTGGDAGVSKVISSDHVRVIEEGGTLSEEDRQLTFTVGSVRNPCDYYVSCWAFSGRLPAAVQKAGGFQETGGEEYYGTSDELNTPEDQQRFGKWLRHVMPDGLAPGLLTARLLWSYANQSVANASRPEPNLQGWAEEDRLTYYAAALSFDPSSVDCWVRTETLTDDLRRCLVLFEDRAGSGIVNWNEFNETVALREGEHEDVKDVSMKNVWTKNSGHQPCEFYFDKANADFVLETDSTIFSKFGYSACCT